MALEIESILTNRPIGADYDDDPDGVLTPNLSIFGRRLESSCEVNEEKIGDNSNNNKHCLYKKGND